MIPLRYRDDPGLEFLQFCSHEDLEPLVEILAKDKGENRWAGSLEGNKEFARHPSELPLVWRLIAAELQRFGADSVASAVRLGHGICYREILTDACKQLKAPRGDKKDELVEIELGLLSKVLTDSLEKMSPEELEAFVQSFGEYGNELGLGNNAARMAPAALAAAVRTAIAAGGFNTCRLAVIVARWQLVEENPDLVAQAISRLAGQRHETLAFLNQLFRLVPKLTPESQALALDYFHATLDFFPKAVFVETQAAYKLERFHLGDHIRQSSLLAYDECVGGYRTWANSELKKVISGAPESAGRLLQDRMEDARRIISSPDNRVLLEHSV